MFSEQGGVCKICAIPPGEQELSVDHNHKTGQVRGLLCHMCNVYVGLFENADLAGIEAYLKEYE